MSSSTTVSDNNAEVAPAREVQGAAVPSFFYGTAWKEERTQQLTKNAIDAGFRGIDTANQRKHYFEIGVGKAVADAIAAETVTRQELFLQTKFTYQRGQDHRLPYDPEASLPEQVQQSFRSSLEHLQTDYIDSYVLHGPSQRYGLSEDDRLVWRAMEGLVKDGQAKHLGISNVGAEQLAALCAEFSVKPAFVQNRCYARLGWDAEVRRVCQQHDIVYQGFSLLTANREVFAHPAFQEIATRNGQTPAQVIFRFALQIGMLPLTGTSSTAHMQEDLRAFDFALSAQEVASIERLVTG